MTEIHPPTSLQLEQRQVQANTFLFRTLEDYEANMFGSRWSEVSDFLGAAVPDAKSIPDLLRGMKDGDDSVHWVEMAGGLAVAMRHAARLQAMGMFAGATLTNVDLFDWTQELPKDKLKTISERQGVDFSDERFAPRLVIADAGRVALEEQADLITCVHAIQYFDNPLGALAHWYNQLKDDGIMVVTRGNAVWSTDVAQEGSAQSRDPFRDLFDQFEGQGVPYAAREAAANTYRRESRGREMFTTLAIQKQPGTGIQLNASPIEREVEQHGDKFVRYNDAHPALELVAA